ncbi:MAG: glutamate 5-kinase [Oscillospiraceae bacterium]|jgi:glutamate 5-kinase|nr:glutamate 5-kinase [Oscillospiraceae bacterium]
MRIVVKIGTSTVIRREDNSSVNIGLLDRLSKVLSDLRGAGHQIILVSSGAIAVGSIKLKLAERPTTLRMKQAAAAIGQLELMHLYDKFFGEYGQSVAQILLTDTDVDSLTRRAHLLNTFDALLELGVIPIVNENDSVSANEIETGDFRVLGDNDTLSAIVAALINADLLLLLSDVDALYDSDPHTNPKAVPFREVRGLAELEKLRTVAGSAGTWGTGGMATKLNAAQKAMENGIAMYIQDGENVDKIYSMVSGEQTGTRFFPK